MPDTVDWILGAEGSAGTGLWESGCAGKGTPAYKSGHTGERKRRKSMNTARSKKEPLQRPSSDAAPPTIITGTASAAEPDYRKKNGGRIRTMLSSAGKRFRAV